jgi:hypothetical protein
MRKATGTLRECSENPLRCSPLVSDIEYIKRRVSENSRVCANCLMGVLLERLEREFPQPVFQGEYPGCARVRGRRNALRTGGSFPILRDGFPSSHPGCGPAHGRIGLLP